MYKINLVFVITCTNILKEIFEILQRGYLLLVYFDIYLTFLFNKPTKLASKWKAVGKWPLLYCSAGRQSTTKYFTPSP